MNINHLTIFYAVAEEGSLSQAAERLKITASGVSQRLADLERSLDTRLFDRTSKGMRPTDAGKLLHDYARRLFKLEAEACRALADLKQLNQGKLTLGATPLVGTYLLPELLARFRQEYPCVEVQLVIAGTDLLVEQLQADTLDLVLSEDTSSHYDDNVQSTEFAQDELVAIVAPQHPLVGQTSVSLLTFCHEPLVLPEIGLPLRSLLDRLFAAHELDMRPSMVLGNIEAIKRVVAAGGGVAIVPQMSILHEVQSGQLAILPLSVPLERCQIYHIQISHRYFGQAAAAFLPLLCKDIDR